MYIILFNNTIIVEYWKLVSVKNEPLRQISKQVKLAIVPLWTFHLHVATFQQHLYMEYIFDVRIRYSFAIHMLSLMDDCC